jgi:methenyltetrahydrofolate cyclohydrolase
VQDQATKPLLKENHPPPPAQAAGSSVRYDQLPVDRFTEALASGEPTPGGGAGAALAGATGAALVSMVCNLTIGREKFRSVEPEMRSIREKADRLRTRLLGLLQADTEVYAEVMRTYRLPRATAEEKSERAAAIQAALKAACQVPIETARACAEVIDLCPTAARLGNVSAVSDVGVGGILAEAALESAALNVMINLAAIKDEPFVAATRAEITALVATKSAEKATIVRAVEATIG